MRGEVEAEAPLPRELKLYYLFVYNRRLRHRSATALLKATLGWAHGLLLAMRPISSGGGGAKRGARVPPPAAPLRHGLPEGYLRMGSWAALGHAPHLQRWRRCEEGCKSVSLDLFL
ncbi:Os05g0158800 [Oryza sativa Japonica Group]|uniref:Os05g0158800 protein n=1 Tax=Oryza sativa subsp. japonica TaxID=39947 RepID=A0A0P0WI82_ORYSJ|nr:Os05g0158800 [Oryza sativa Japonica Group]